MRKLKGGFVALAATALVAAATLSDPGYAQDHGAAGGSDTAISDSGKDVFEQICAACHMPDAKGGGEAGARVPALAGNKNLKNKDYPIILLLKGRGGMPWFTDILTKQQIAAVITYVRGHFNDYKDPVTVADIDRIGSTNPPVPDCNCGH